MMVNTGLVELVSLDCNNLQYEMNKVGMKSYIISNVLKRNTEKDRPEQDWTLQTKRAVI